MADPFPSPPGTNPPRHVALNSENTAMGWMLGTLAAAMILALGLFLLIVPRGVDVAPRIFC